jgi:quercetin dioxygenase-like cupin family protein
VTIAVGPKHTFTYDGAVLNIFHANVGEGLPRHDHPYAHATFCTSGRCIVRKENKQLIMDKATTPINLLENEWHEIEALEDGTVFVNVFAEYKL